MHIDKTGINSASVAPESAAAATSRTPKATPAGGEPTAPSRSDRARFSAAARALASGDVSGKPLDAERIAQVRARILDGSYNAPATVTETARRLLASGDIG